MLTTITLQSAKSSLLVLFLLFLFSCAEDPTEPTNGVDGVNGFNALVKIDDEPAGENCSNGGVRISVGQDANDNGTLDDSEVESVSFVCNGGTGNDGASGSQLVARTSPESPGENCEAGGTLVEIGADINDNNTLDNDEVQTSFFVCNGVNGAGAGENGLSSLIRATPDDTCPNGGIFIEVGLDLNDNGELDGGEIQSSYSICNGSDGANGTNGSNGYSTLSNVISEAPGPNCANGGLKVELGLDTNRNGALDNEEVVSENYVCNGSNGSNGTNGNDGISSITRVTTEDPGDNCPNGGLKIEIGMDDTTTDGILQNEEVDYTYYVCNGANGSNGTNGSNGLNSIIRTTSEPSGANCTNGGIRIDIGLDSNSNNALDPGEEIGGPLYVCNGTDGANGTNGSNGTDGRNVIVVSNTDVSCPAGGVELTFGYDDDSNGTIDEVLETALICNGENGADGQDGLNSIVKSTTESPGTNCPNGGTFIEVGIDDNRNNMLDPAEVDASFYVCNGTDGSNGSNGRNSLITVTSFSGSQGDCTNGGLIIRTGVDDNGDGTLQAGEVDATSYVCDGSDGSNGSSDGIFEFYYQEGLDGYTGVADVSISDKNPPELGESFSVDRGTTDSHGLIHFPELEKLPDLVGEEFQIVEAILYLRGKSTRIDGQSTGNWIGVKTILPEAPLFEEDAVSWTRANSSDENWSLPGVTSRNQDGDADSYSDMYQLPPTGNFAFDGYIPLQLSKSVVTSWTDKETGKDSNKGIVLIMADGGVQYELDIFTSNYSKDSNYRPLLYLKVKTGNKARSVAETEYKQQWKSMTYEEKLAPLKKLREK
ncbi:MAG: hypothetical protein RLN88_10625 [Ekhidna sp.]|uniref:DUF7151 family protein n=1 Tax=Ekhidna sp. TaxID=2608089 RepID=UPI0032EC9E9D